MNFNCRNIGTKILFISTLFIAVSLTGAATCAGSDIADLHCYNGKTVSTNPDMAGFSEHNLFGRISVNEMEIVSDSVSAAENFRVRLEFEHIGNVEKTETYTLKYGSEVLWRGQAHILPDVSATSGREEKTVSVEIPYRDDLTGKSTLKVEGQQSNDNEFTVLQLDNFCNREPLKPKYEGEDICSTIGSDTTENYEETSDEKNSVEDTRKPKTSSNSIEKTGRDNQIWNGISATNNDNGEPGSFYTPLQEASTQDEECKYRLNVRATYKNGERPENGAITTEALQDGSDNTYTRSGNRLSKLYTTSCQDARFQVEYSNSEIETEETIDISDKTAVNPSPDQTVTVNHQIELEDEKEPEFRRQEPAETENTETREYRSKPSIFQDEEPETYEQPQRNSDSSRRLSFDILPGAIPTGETVTLRLTSTRTGEIELDVDAPDRHVISMGQ